MLKSFLDSLSPLGKKVLFFIVAGFIVVLLLVLLNNANNGDELGAGSSNSSTWNEVPVNNDTPQYQRAPETSESDEVSNGDNALSENLSTDPSLPSTVLAENVQDKVETYIKGSQNQVNEDKFILEAPNDETLNSLRELSIIAAGVLENPDHAPPDKYNKMPNFLTTTVVTPGYGFFVENESVSGSTFSFVKFSVIETDRVHVILTSSAHPRERELIIFFDGGKWQAWKYTELP